VTGAHGASGFPDAGTGSTQRVTRGKRRLQRRAALASTLVAGLELSREGAAMLDQDAAFGAIVVLPVETVQSATATG
jgi:chromatin segregation and condensation protein Rec8/ScpA/Scc1 (kleisin family)